MTVLLALAGVATATSPPHTLTWSLTHGGAKVGQRTLTVRYLGGEGGTGRVIETFTEVRGHLGKVKVDHRHRMTAHVDAREPAAFHSVVDQQKTVLEVQGRWTPSRWVVTTTARGKSRAVDLPLDQVDLSTADLLDPYTRFPLSHYEQVKILSAVTGEVLAGRVEKLGVQELSFGGRPISASGYAWVSAEGRAEYFYSPDGFLVMFREPLLGSEVVGTLQGAPPSGIDDFPVAAPTAGIEEIGVN